MQSDSPRKLSGSFLAPSLCSDPRCLLRKALQRRGPIAASDTGGQISKSMGKSCRVQNSPGKPLGTVHPGEGRPLPQRAQCCVFSRTPGQVACQGRGNTLTYYSPQTLRGTQDVGPAWATCRFTTPISPTPEHTQT